MTKEDIRADIRKWLRCPQCYSRNILYVKISNGYDCRHCGAFFRADFDKREVYLERTARSLNNVRHKQSKPH